MSIRFILSAILVGTLHACGAAHAADLCADQCAYPTPDEAAIAAERAALPLSSHYEYGGAIYRTSAGLYAYTTPQTSHDAHHIEIRAKFAGKLVAVYHTHPGLGDSNKEFSPDDKDVARTLRVPSYIGVVADQSVRRYDPSQSRSIVL